MKTKTLSLVIGSIVTSAAASVCCWLPALLGAGAAGSVGIAHAFMPYRPYLLGLSALMIGRGLWLAYVRKPKDCCTAQEHRLRRRISIAMMWTTAAFAVVMAVLPMPMSEHDQGGAMHSHHQTK